jgi:cell wall-associated NlpC family hydrolase
MVAFKKGANRSLPHYTGGIQKRGVKVSKKNLKRGDIIFPQKGHVGIYLGNGLMVHASSGHGKVIVAKPYGFYTARRVL